MIPRYPIIHRIVALRSWSSGTWESFHEETPNSFEVYQVAWIDKMV